MAGYSPVVAPTYSGWSSSGRFRSMTKREYSAATTLAPSSQAKSYRRGMCQSVSGKLRAASTSPSSTAGVSFRPACGMLINSGKRPW
ncbi:hypothetical protein D3C81_2180380 [compost metagenome]